MSNRSWWSLGRERAPERPPPKATERLARTKIIVVGNEKGGAGKTTVASLIAIAMLYRGAKVTVIDLDLRQSSLGRFLEYRRRYLERSRERAPMPVELKLADDTDALSREDPAGIVALFERAIMMAQGQADIVVIDTPGGDTPVSRAAHLQADLLVTPMNDSFVDFDVLGSADPAKEGYVRPSHYSRVVHEARRARAGYGLELDWVVMPNRLANFGARNRDRLQAGVRALGEQVGFRLAPGLRERVIYRELFPYGLTLADIQHGVRLNGLSEPRETVREEVEEMLRALDLGHIAFDSEPIRSLSARFRW
ncbi:MAG TPA: division plane positioning ATPase MipZ [Caulobacteraceae bacterium]|nr:division plane positioning ATPase MipZ [Caulobacteraceae bacterium]